MLTSRLYPILDVGALSRIADRPRENFAPLMGEIARVFIDSDVSILQSVGFVMKGGQVVKQSARASQP